jgi:hypothetical protein
MGGDARSIKEVHIIVGGRLDMHGPTLQSLIEVLGWSSRGGAPLAAEEKKRKEFERKS